MNTRQMRKFAEQYTRAWCSQQAASVSAFFAQDGALYVNGVPASGREAITAVAQGFMTAFPTMVLHMDELDIQSEKVIYHWTFSGTNNGPGGTGNTVRFSGYEEWIFGEEGLITRSLGHFDEDDYRYQLEHGVQGNNGQPE